jgi:hypothetical protein
MAAPNPPPGPAPVAQMYEDEMDVSMDDAYGNNDDAGNNDDEGNNESDSMLSGDTSETETETSDDESREAVDWEAVGLDFLLTKEALDAIGQRKPIPRRPTDSSPPPDSPPPGSTRGPLHPPPSRTPLSGDKTFMQWIPYWSDPKWNDVYYTIDEDGKETGWVDVPPLDKQRPALLPMDALRDPTPYAKRFGVHAHQTDGRSRMSPTTSTTRRAQLSHVQETLTGRKDYLTIQDANIFLHDTEPNMTSSEYLKSLLAESKGNTEHIEAYLRLHDMLEEDEAWQQTAFVNVTTDEVNISISPCSF